MRQGLPVRAYVLTLPAAVLAFMGLAVLDQRETFLSALRAGAAVAAKPTPAAGESSVAEKVIRDFDAALQRAYADGEPDGVSALCAPALTEEIRRELSHPATARAARGLAVTDLTVLQLEPAGEDAWQALTDETWEGHGVDGSVRRSRLRFRYRVVRPQGAWRVEEMSPVLPEAERDAPR